MNGLMTPARISISTSATATSVTATPNVRAPPGEVEPGPRCHRRILAGADARFGIRDAAARFLAEVVPDLGDVVAERVARHDFGIARMRQLDRDRTLEPPGAIGHHQHPVGELDRFGQVVRDEERRLLQSLLDLQHLVAQQEARLLVERGERLVHQQDPRLGGERSRDRDALAHAARQLGRVAPLEAGQTDERDEMERALEPLRPSPGRPVRVETRRCPARCATGTSTLPGTPCRSPECVPVTTRPWTVTLPS